MDKQDKDIVKSIVKSPQWTAFKLVSEEMIQKTRSESVNKESQFETLKAVFEREGKIRGIQQFIMQLEQYAND